MAPMDCGYTYGCMGLIFMRTLSCFDAWGQRKQIRELFCTEYFLMQPVSKNRSFTVTYHFIVDEQDAAGVYYLPLLTDISGWIYLKNKNGKRKTLTNPATTTYQKLVKVFLGLLIILFMMSYQILK